jgi:transcriptional regulator with PAS, ATPase and Fis domain
MENVYRAMEAAMRTDAPVLIEGESGTGKELVAKAIHYNGLRREKRFFPVDCGAIPETLLESELFGYKKGAFTGAHIDKKGFFEEVDEGSLFLDEIGNTTVSFQAKLLRVLQEGEIRRIGESNIRQVNVRIIAATNVDLEENINAGKFREDLYYRLNVININLPPLRERKEDLPLLSEYFLEKSAKNLGMRKKILCEAVVQILVNYSWPGNIRELSNEMERITAFLEDREQIFPNDLHPRILKTVEKPGLKLLKTAHDMQIQENYEKTIKDQISHLPDWLLQNEIRSIEELEDWYIRLIFEKLNRNQLQTAKALKIGRSTLLRKLRLI